MKPTVGQSILMPGLNNQIDQFMDVCSKRAARTLPPVWFFSSDYVAGRPCISLSIRRRSSAWA